jgi:hypothetical protein
MKEVEENHKVNDNSFNMCLTNELKIDHANWNYKHKVFGL